MKSFNPIFLIIKAAIKKEFAILPTQAQLFFDEKKGVGYAKVTDGVHLFESAQGYDKNNIDIIKAKITEITGITDVKTITLNIDFNNNNASCVFTFGNKQQSITLQNFI